MFRICAIILVLTSICFSQQTDNSKKESITRGEDVIRKAREAAKLSSSINSFQIKLHQFADYKAPGMDAAIDYQDEITISSPNKIRKLTTYDSGSLNRSIWNDASFKQTFESNRNGQRRVYDTTNGIQLGGNAANAVKSKKPNVNSPQSIAAEFSDSLWGLVFPLTLTHPIESSAKFEYVGRAQAGDQTASFVQTKSAGGHLIQLFFDEKTSSLLLLIEKFSLPGRDFERKYYYSNREERDGVLIPTKVKIEHKTTPKGQSPNILFEHIDLLDFDANPPINPEIFKIK